MPEAARVGHRQECGIQAGKVGKSGASQGLPAGNAPGLGPGMNPGCVHAFHCNASAAPAHKCCLSSLHGCPETTAMGMEGRWGLDQAGKVITSGSAMGR